MTIRFDHLVVGAATLADGEDWAMRVLKVRPPFGGAHPGRGTHNLLARLPAGYLEIIAPDPEQPNPERPRWFGLDDPAMIALVTERPRPISWVLSTPDLDKTAAAAGWDVGRLADAARGDLTWRLTEAPGGVPAEGVLPALIEWPARLEHRAPTDRMADLGLALRALRLKHPEPKRIAQLLETVGAFDAMAAAGVSLRVLAAEKPAIETLFTSEHLEITM